MFCAGVPTAIGIPLLLCPLDSATSVMGRAKACDFGQSQMTGRGIERNKSAAASFHVNGNRDIVVFPN